MKKFLLLLSIITCSLFGQVRPLSPVAAAQKAINALSNAGYLSYFDYIQFPAALNQFPSTENYITGVQTGSYITNTSSKWVKRVGFVPDGSTAYATTTYTPSAGTAYQKNDCHLGVYLTSTSTVNSVDIGAYDGTNGTWFAAIYGDGHSYTRLNASTSADHGIKITDARGYLTAERSNSTQEKLYKDGVLLSTISNTSTSVPAVAIWAGGLNSSGSILLPSNRTIGIITIGKSGVNNPTVVSIFNQYFSDISAPIKTVYWYGDSFTFGQNASTKFSGFVGDVSAIMKWNFVNKGVSGQAVCVGCGAQPGFDTTTIVPKSGKDYKVIMNWYLNDAYNIYFNGTETITQCTTAVGNVIGAFSRRSYTPSTDIIYVLGWKVGQNSFYTQAQLNTLVAAIRTKLSSLNVQYTVDFSAYTLNADSVHPAGDASYSNIANQIYNQLKW